jgi:hypothetical protein
MDSDLITLIKNISPDVKPFLAQQDGFEITEPLNQLVWQYVRYNPDYIKEFNSINDVILESGETEHRIDDFYSKWCLGLKLSKDGEFPTGIPDPTHSLFPDGFIFCLPQVFINRTGFTDPQIMNVAVDLSCDKKTAVKLFQQLLERVYVDGNTRLIKKSSGIGNMAENFIIFYLKDICGLPNIEIIQTFESLFGKSRVLTDSSLDGRINIFKNDSKRSPQLFFFKPGR